MCDACSGCAVQVRWDDLAVTSCALLDPALTFCYYVGNGIPSIVGFELLPTQRRRRLLALENAELDTGEAATAAAMLWNASWSGTSSLCRDLIHAYRESLDNFGFFLLFYSLTRTNKHTQAQTRRNKRPPSQTGISSRSAYTGGSSQTTRYLFLTGPTRLPTPSRCRGTASPRCVTTWFPLGQMKPLRGILCPAAWAFPHQMWSFLFSHFAV